ncbi:hypothetical protein G6L37_03240 [Agrobacterium rubi]|nr:hypothetical protein [Agrobacterium rubi]NTF24390.1 hypothetical protein [Agrobacterium rubi]
MGLIENAPSSHRFEYMIGAVAFERSFAELYHVLQENSPCSTEEGMAIVVDTIEARERPYIDVAYKGIVHVYGTGCNYSEMELCLAGYIAEARERFIMRAAEIEVANLRANLNALYGATDDEPWEDAADAFKR